MKRTFLLKMMLLLCALVAGSSSVWAQAPVNTVLWSEDFSGFAANANPSGDYTNSHTGTTVYGGVTVTYSKTNGGGTTQTYTDGGPNGNANLLIAKGNGTLSVSGISTGQATELTVSYAKSGDGTIAVSSSTTNVEISGSTITTNGATTLQLTFTNTHNSKNLRIDDISVKVKTAGTSGSGVAAPTFSVEEGAVTAGTTVELSQADNKTIKYTTDGTEPSKTVGTVYSSAITITKPVTIKAVAVDGDDVSAVSSASYTISVVKPTFDVAAGSVVMGTPLTITATAGHTIIYTTDGTDPSYASSIGDIYDSPIAINSAMTVKAIAVDDYDNESEITSAAYTVTYPGEVDITPNYTFFGKNQQFSGNTYDVVSGTKDGITVTCTRNTGSLYANSSAMRFYKDNNLKIEAPSGMVITNVSLDASLGSASNDITCSLEGYTPETFTWTGNAASVTFSRPSNASSYITINIITVVLAAKTTMNDYEWSTFVSDKALDFTNSGMKAYIVTGYTGNALNKTEVTKVPANTPLLLNAPEGTYTIPVAASGTAYTDNKLKAGTGAAVAKEDGKTKYVLSLDDNDNIAFMKINNDPATVPADKAYLEFNEVVSAPSFGFGDATAIDEVRSKTEDVRDDFYNLNGQRVANPTKGLYIVNGKKYIVK